MANANCTPAPATPTRAGSIPAARVARALDFLESRMHDSKDKSNQENDFGRQYYLGRSDAFELAVAELREVLL